MGKKFKKIQFSTRYVAMLFDCYLTDKRVDKKKFKDLTRAGHIISKLYIKSNNGSEEAKEILQELADWYKAKALAFREAIESADKKAVFVESDYKLQFEAEMYWDNEIYLGVADMLQYLDRYAIALDRALNEEVISKKQLFHFRKALANPPRSIINKVFEIAKAHKSIIFQD